VYGFVNYMVSDAGRVKSVNPRKGSRANVNGGILKTSVQKCRGGYMRSRVTLRCDGKSRYMRVATLVLDAFEKPHQVGQVARHLNGNSLDNRLCNLKWGTQKENHDDAVKHGTHRNPPPHYGESHPMATISDADVRIIREHTFERGDYSSFARRFNVAPITIRRIHKGESRL